MDSGATYTLLPHDVSKALDLAPKRTATFNVADGTHIGRQVPECHITLPEGEGLTPVLVTLEILGLMLHPFKRTLEPMRMLLA